MREEQTFDKTGSKKETKTPRHIAFIMDGNGRWARRRGMPRTFGHRAGLEAMRRVIRSCGQLGIEVVTFYAFSTENWSRSPEEVNFLMNLPVEFIDQDLPEMMKNNIKLIVTGSDEHLPLKTLEAIGRGVKMTAANTGLVVNLAFNYGGRDEIVRAVRRLAENLKNAAVTPEEINENTIRTYLDHPELPDPDLIIRTSGEQRLSNFLLWESAYSEFYFAPELWPEINGDVLTKIIAQYQQRDRRFGNAK
ncbi:MAG: isoprenyl transferase [Negativicutes bacterium]|nr:isoprenyl transferase [Negativicutes bacterium]